MECARIRQPSGVEVGLIIENLAEGWCLVFGIWYLVLGTWYLVLGECFATLCLTGIPPIHAQKRRENGSPLGLGGAWVALGPPKGHPSATQGRPKGRIAKVLCLQQNVKICRGVGAREARHSG